MVERVDIYLEKIRSDLEELASFGYLNLLQPRLTPDFDQEFLLWKSAERGQLEIVQFLSYDEVETYLGLYGAVENEHLEVIQHILEYRANNGYYNDADEILCKGCLNNQPEVVKYFLDNGCDVNARNGLSLRRACTKGHLNVVQLLLDNGADIYIWNDRPLQVASREGHLEVVRLLLDWGADIHARNDYSLRCACYEGHLDIVRILLDNGADIHTGNDSPLRLATGQGHLEIVRLLLNRGADIHTMNDRPLRLSSGENHSKVIELLVDNGANNRILKYRSKSDWEIFRRLLERGVVNNPTYNKVVSSLQKKFEKLYKI